LPIGRLRLGGSQFKVSLDKQFSRPHLQNNQSKMDYRYGSSVRVPEFKPLFHKKKKKKKKRERERETVEPV
jgi:hypothetical protein